jgi:hypothetical protein
MVFGTPITCTPEPSALTPREQRLGEHGGVGVRIVTADDDDGVELCLMQVSRTCANCSSLLILVRSEPRKSKPPVLMTKSTSASVISNSEPLSRPFGPALTPKQGVAGAEHALQAADDVVAAGGRAAREQDGDALALDVWACCRRR